MAIKVFDGFDHYRSQVDLQSRQGALEWNDVNVDSLGFVVGRGGYGYAVEVNGGAFGNAWFGGSFNANLAAGLPAIAIRIPPSATAFFDLQLMDYAKQTAQVTLRCYTDSGLILAFSGDPNSLAYTATQIGATPPNAFNPYIWNKFGISYVAGPTGAVALQINGATVLSLSGVTTVAPVASPNNWFNGFRVFFPPGDVGPIAYLDDFDLCDTTTGPGSFPCNSFMGDVAARTIFAAANYAVQWAPLTGANWQEIGEVQFDGDTSYNSATTIGAKDLFTFGSLPSTVAAVFAVQMTGGYRKLDASAQTIVQNLVSGGTSVTGAAWNMSLSYSYVTDLIVLDPHTGATWTPTAVNALIAGYTLNN